MKECPDCKRTQPQGSYCLDCGCKLKEVEKRHCKFKPMQTNRSTDTLKKDVRTWLTRIGVLNPDIKIMTEGHIASIKYIIDGKEYLFSSEHQSDARHNLAAVEMFLHHRVLGIERGIENIQQAFKGYTAIEYGGGLFDELNKRRKKLAKKMHPDLEGDTTKFQDMNRQFELTKKRLGFK